MDYKNVLYRCVSKLELDTLIFKGIIKSKNKEYISVSSNELILDGTEFSDSADYFILFNKRELTKQNGIKIKYNIKFLYQDLTILNHVTGFNNIKEFEEMCLEEKEKPNEYLHLYSWEMETVFKELKFTKNLIVDIWDSKNNCKSVKSDFLC